VLSAYLSQSVQMFLHMMLLPLLLLLAFAACPNPFVLTVGWTHIDQFLHILAGCCLLPAASCLPSASVCCLLAAS